MFSNVLKLSRRLLILAVLSGGLFVTLVMMPSNSAQATGAKCCSECELDEGLCQAYCQIHPTFPLCAECQDDVRECFRTCNPDPGC
jgi:hypothetical protein